MSLARLVITAVVVEGRRVAEVASAYVTRSWVYELVARYRIEGDAALSHAPGDRTRARGVDAGADTIRWHLTTHHDLTVSQATIYRILCRAGLVTPEPARRPRSSYIRFQADQPNETWQADFTHYRLADGSDVEILCWLDDHSRYAISVTAHRRVTGPIVVDTFTNALEDHGIPASTLTDNGMVFTTRLAGGRGGRNGFEHLLDSLGITQKNSRPNHPTTCGKVERFHQTLKRWLDVHPAPATIAELQTLLDVFVDEYNQHRPHRSLHDRTHGELHHIGLGRHLHGTPVIMLIDDLDVRVIHATTGEILRQLNIDPTRRYHGTGQPRGGPRTNLRTPQNETRQTLNAGSAVSDVSRHHRERTTGFEPATLTLAR
jgi:transposase InsO family protein